MSVPAELIQRVMAAQNAGSGLLIPEILSGSEMGFMQSVWPQIRSAAALSHVNWGAIGYPNGPALSAPSYAAMAYVWPQVRVAADFSHPNWSLVPVPSSVVAAAMPVPEAPPAAPVPVTPSAAPEPAAPAPPVVQDTPRQNWVPTFPVTSAPAPPVPTYYDAPPPVSMQPIDEETGEPVPLAPVQAGFGVGIPWPMILGLLGLGFVVLGNPLKGRRGSRRRRRR